MSAPDEYEIHDERAHDTGARYVLALIGLLCLTGLSFALHFVELGAAGTLVALLIAGCKVVIVGLVFMELLESMVATRMVAVICLLFVALLCLGILGDVEFR